MAVPDDTPTAAPPAPPPTPPASDEGAIERLRAAAVRGGLFTLFGYGASQVLRLASNLILTRLLAPEHFGLMALVNSCMTALQMFSDLGVRVSIVQDREGDAPRFLNTAWTLNTIRGTVLWLVACALAWPVARFYEQPDLLALIPVVSLQALIMGFHSTNWAALSRHMALGRLTAIDLGVQLVSLATMCGWAYFISRSVWALVVGSLVNAVLRVFLSHTLLPGVRNWFLWDREVAGKLIRFGRWITISTILTYVADKSDRLILGAVMTISMLGVYNIAAFMAQAVIEGLSAISQRILFPLYARLSEVEQGPALSRRIFRARALLHLLTLPPLAFLIACPDLVLELLYDDRFHGGAWVLRTLAAGAVVSAISLTSSPVLLARGDSFRHMAVLASRTVALIAGLAWVSWTAPGRELAARLGMEQPQVLVVALNPLLGYPVLSWATRRYGVWMPGLDLLSVLSAAALTAFCLLLRSLVGL